VRSLPPTSQSKSYWSGERLHSEFKHQDDKLGREEPSRKSNKQKYENKKKSNDGQLSRNKFRNMRYSSLEVGHNRARRSKSESKSGRRPRTVLSLDRLIGQRIYSSSHPEAVDSSSGWESSDNEEDLIRELMNILVHQVGTY